MKDSNYITLVEFIDRLLLLEANRAGDMILALFPGQQIELMGGYPLDQGFCVRFRTNRMEAELIIPFPSEDDLYLMYVSYRTLCRIFPDFTVADYFNMRGQHEG